MVGLLELYFEQDAPGANITTGGDCALVGLRHRDDRRLRRPVPGHAGRPDRRHARCSTVGVALFATFSGFLANAFLSRKPEHAAPAAEPEACRQRCSEVERLLVEQQKATETLRARLTELEQP